MQPVITHEPKLKDIEVVESLCKDVQGKHAFVTIRAKNIPEAQGPDAKRVAIRYAETQYRYVRAGVDRAESSAMPVREDGTPATAADMNLPNAEGRLKVQLTYKIRNSV